MKDATLAQGNQVLNLILQKETPAKQLQALNESGLLSDLLDANVEVINRDDFRRICGLKPLMPTVKVLIDPAKSFVRDMAKESGWTLLEDLKYQPGEVELGLCEFLNSDESWIKGEEMARRAIKLGANLGQKHAEWLLEHQDQIPMEWRNFYITFPGTVWRGSDDGRGVAFLYWSGDRWYLSFSWLEGGWGDGYRLLRTRK